MTIPVPYFTIDSASTRDIDDAIFCEQLECGFRVWIAIADPTELAKIGSLEDTNARLLGASVYSRDRVVQRMLPMGISEVRASLVAGAERKAFVFKVTLGETLGVRDFEVQHGRIKVAARLTYEDVAALLDINHPGVKAEGEAPLERVIDERIRKSLALSATLSNMLLKIRRQSGALALFDLTRLLLTDEDGQVNYFASKGEMVGHLIVQEFMILCNRLAAKFLVENNIPAIYRNHEPRVAAPAANELALEIQQWMSAPVGYPLAEHVQERLAVVAGRATYGASVKGHYGLALPFYAHVTSPLRRYADLVNVRQIKAFVRHADLAELPYSNEDLKQMAEHLTDALSRRKEERAQGFKAAVQVVANRALEDNMLNRLADHELVQAIKLVRAQGSIPEPLTAELVRRFTQLIITDKVSDCLFVDVPSELLGRELKHAFGLWISSQPARAMHMLLHAAQVGHISKLSISAIGQANRFEGAAGVMTSDGQLVGAVATGSRKRDAEQHAAVRLLFVLMKLPLDALSAEDQENVSAAQSVDDGNPKGALLEWCQHKGVPFPEFTTQGRGVHHAMTFDGEVSLSVAGRLFTGVSRGAASKRAAEALAARNLLAQLLAEDRTSSTPEACNPAATMANAISELQELAQRFKVSLPQYEFETLAERPPKFSSTVTSFVSGKRRFTGTAASKQGAKLEAARLAVTWIRSASCAS